MKIFIKNITDYKQTNTINKQYNNAPFTAEINYNPAQDTYTN